MPGEEVDHRGLDGPLGRGLPEVDVTESVERVGDRQPGRIVVEDARVDVRGTADRGGVPEVVRDFWTARLIARFRAVADVAACPETATPTAARTVAVQVRKSLAVNSSRPPP